MTTKNASSVRTALRAALFLFVAAFVASALSSCQLVPGPYGPMVAPGFSNCNNWRMAPTMGPGPMFCGRPAYTTMMSQYRPSIYGNNCSYGSGVFNSRPFYSQPCYGPSVGAPWQARWNPPPMYGPVNCAPRMPVYIQTGLRGYGGRMW